MSPLQPPPEGDPTSDPSSESKKKYFAPPEGQSANDYNPSLTAPTLTEAAKTIKLEDFGTLHERPCVRDSYLTGMTVGFVLGGLRFVLGGGVARTCNWAVGSFVGTSLASYEWCLYRRRKEKEGVVRAMEILETKRVEREERLRKRREESERRKAEEEARSRPWYRFW